MPIPAPTMKVTCQSCGWSRLIYNRSDVIFMPRQCGRCGSDQLTHKTAGTLDKLNPISIIESLLR